MESLNKKIEENPSLSDVSSVFGYVTPTGCNPFEDCFSDFYNPSLLPEPNITLEIAPSGKSNQCPSCSKNLRFHHISSGRQLPVPCNKYICPVCGKKKAKILYKAIHTWLQQFKYIRMWTLTLSGDIVRDDFEHYKTLQEAWRRFITEIRRSKYLSKRQRQFQYVRVAELHEGKHNSPSIVTNKGKVHFHVFVSEYIEVKYLQSIWNHIIQDLTGSQVKSGNVNIEGIPTPEIAAHYVTNYVLKSAKLLESRQKKWTKSGKTAIMVKFKSSGDWLVINLNFPLIDQVCLPEAQTYYNFKNIGTTSQTIEGLPPPNIFLCEISTRKNANFDFVFELFPQKRPSGRP